MSATLTHDTDNAIDATSVETATPHHTSPLAAGRKTTLGRITKSEFVKFRTVRSNIVTLGGSMLAAVGFGALFSSLADDNSTMSPIRMALGGFDLSVIIVTILGVAIVANEYSTGLIRSWFGAAPDRLRVVAAKVGVFGALTFVTTLIAAFASFFISGALLPKGIAALTLSSTGVLQALFGTAFYAAAIAIVGVGLGFVLRSTAGGAGIVVAILLLAPIMALLLPDSIGDPLSNILPSNAGAAVQGLGQGNDLTATTGALVLTAWATVSAVAAAITVKRRDA